MIDADDGVTGVTVVNCRATAALDNGAKFLA